MKINDNIMQYCKNYSTPDENILDKWVKVLTDSGYTVPIWEEYDISGKKAKGRKEVYIYSPGTNFVNETKTISNNIDIECHMFCKNDFLNFNNEKK